MKNKKPKTIKEIVQSYDISEDWESMYREIKQLIADEVIGEDVKPLASGSIWDFSAKALNEIKKEQRKKLERL